MYLPQVLKSSLIRKTSMLKVIIVVFISPLQNRHSKSSTLGMVVWLQTPKLEWLSFCMYDLHEDIYLDMPSSFETRQVDFRGLLWKALHTSSIVFSFTLSLSVHLRSSALPVSLKFTYLPFLLLTSERFHPYSFLNLYLTLAGKFVLWYCKTHPSQMPFWFRWLLSLS